MATNKPTVVYDYIPIKVAVEREHVSRYTLMRWAKAGSIRSFVRGNMRYVSEGDVLRRRALRQTGSYGATDAELADRLADQIVMAMPALTDDELARLEGLIANGRRAL